MYAWFNVLPHLIIPFCLSGVNSNNRRLRLAADYPHNDFKEVQADKIFPATKQFMVLLIPLTDYFLGS
jgi:hypothetical protein